MNAERGLRECPAPRKAACGGPGPPPDAALPRGPRGRGYAGRRLQCRRGTRAVITEALEDGASPFGWRGEDEEARVRLRRRHSRFLGLRLTAPRGALPKAAVGRAA